MMTVSNKDINLMTWNVNGLNNPMKKKKVLSHINSKGSDLIYLQETHLVNGEAQKLNRGWVGHVSFSCGNGRSRGVAILINKRLQFKCLKEDSDGEGRIVLILAEIQGLKVILANVYAPNIDDPAFYGLF